MKTAIFGQFDNIRLGVFDRNGQKAHLRIHLSLYPSLYDLPFKSSSPYKLNLDIDIRSSKSVIIFKRKMKKYLISLYMDS